MIEYEIALVEDRGSYWEVTNVAKNGLITEDKKEKYLKLSYLSYKKIQRALMDCCRVKITKPLRFGEVLPDEVEVLEIDFNEIDHVRAAAIKRARMIITPELASVSALAMYGFICLNNELADRGFFITDGNREAHYLKILETGDEELISKLEDYLNYRDEISRVSALNVRFDKFRMEIRNETDASVITEAVDGFLETFYANY